MGSCFSVGLKTGYSSVDGDEHVVDFDQGRNQESSRGNSQEESAANLKSFSFKVLKKATRNFHPDSMLGEGTFGSVFKGWIDEQSLEAAKPGTGTAVSVKWLTHYGFRSHQEWLSEIGYFGQLNHQNIIKLIGYCLEDDNRFLVYEFMRGGSLEDQLFKRGSNSHPLSWDLRFKLALGAAKGLAYLHSDLELKVINLNFKSSNILIDSSYNAKLSDLVLVKGQQFDSQTVAFTPNPYASPEYSSLGNLIDDCHMHVGNFDPFIGLFSTRSEIYSFGMVLLELLTGRRCFDENRPCGEQGLVDFVDRILKRKQKNILHIMDPSIQGQYSSTVATRTALLAIKCVENNPKYRPNAEEVVNTLEQIQELQKASESSSK